MLSPANRLTASQLFARAVRKGHRAGGSTLVVHLAVPDADSGAPAQVGFVVSRAVGTAVTRNLVKRRLRHLARERLSSLPGSAVLVVRALPAAGTASYVQLAADFEATLGRVLRRLPDPAATGDLS